MCKEFRRTPCTSDMNFIEKRAKDIVKLYIKKAIENCPDFVFKVLRKQQNSKTKGVRSFAVLPVVTDHQFQIG